MWAPTPEAQKSRGRQAENKQRRHHPAYSRSRQPKLLALLAVWPELLYVSRTTGCFRHEVRITLAAWVPDWDDEVSWVNARTAHRLCRVLIMTAFNANDHVSGTAPAHPSRRETARMRIDSFRASWLDDLRPRRAARFPTCQVSPAGQRKGRARQMTGAIYGEYDSTQHILGATCL